MLFTLDSWDTHNFWIVPAYGLPEDVQVKLRGDVAEFKERTWRKDRATGRSGWVLPVTQVTLEHLHATWKAGEDFQYTPNARLMTEHLTMLGLVDEKKAVKRWEYLFNGQESDFAYPTLREPKAHQRVAVEAMVDQDAFALLMEPGTGKTKCVIDELGIYLRRLEPGQVLRALIVCPRSLRVVWQREFRKDIEGLQNIAISLLDGGLDAAESLAALWQDPARLKIGIVSYDSVPAMLPALVLFAPDYVAVDESHYVKSHTTRRYKNLIKLREVSSFRRILTGTPTGNSLVDLWSQFEFLRKGALGFQNYTSFKREFCKFRSIIDPTTGQPTPFDKIEGHKNIEQLKRRMARLSFVVTKDRCLDLPKKVYETRRIDMPPSMRSVYEEFLQNFVVELDADVEMATDVLIVHILRLAQMCSGFMAVTKVEHFDGEFGAAAEDALDNFDTVKREIRPLLGGDTKLREMLDDATTIAETGKLIIWARFNYDCDAIVAGLANRGVVAVSFDGRSNDRDRQTAIDRFNEDPSARVMVAKASSGGVGLTLLGDPKVPINACKTVFYYSNTYSFIQRDQSEDRVHRIGLESAVLYRDYVYADSIEEEIAEVLQSKKSLSIEMKNLSSIKDRLLARKSA
ncbi:MAG: DEAD/DEAH box helicase [Chthoniobacterales bacterium]|nr:DEAD/DEAH box helicase [Chthoniobacterales bacterium]